MLARISLVLTLIVSLLFVTQAPLTGVPVEMKPGGACASMRCTASCCANKACCKVTEQQRVPTTPAPASPSTHVQLATIGLRAYTLLVLPPAPRSPLVISDDVSAAHTLPPLAVSCIRLI